MFGLDEQIASFSDGTTFALVALVAMLLGLRHATDPDHLAAVTTLVVSDGRQTSRRAGALGLAWGAGHAATLFAFGLPIVLYRAYLPAPVESAAETLIGGVIAALAVWLLVRWRRGRFTAERHDHGTYPHLHAHRVERAHEHPRRTRTPFGAFAIGLLHGIGGSAGVGALILSGIGDRGLAVAALAVLALFTAASMAALSTGFGLTASRARVAATFNRLAPVLGTTSLAFGVWYALGAQSVLPYYF